MLRIFVFIFVSSVINFWVVNGGKIVHANKQSPIVTSLFS